MRRKRGYVRCVDAAKIIRDIRGQSPAAVAMFDDKMRFLAFSRGLLSDLQWPSPADVVGRSVYEVLPDIPPRWREVHARVLAGEELTSEEDFFPRQNGRIYWLRWSMKPWRAADGSIRGALLFSEVINEQVAARLALPDSEARVRAPFRNPAARTAHLAPA